MPELQLIPVDHDPFDTGAANAMTHWPEQPNPAAPYLQGARNFAKGGLTEVLKGAGFQLPDWSNRVADVLQNPDNEAAMGMASPFDISRRGFLKGVGAMAASAAVPKMAASFVEAERLPFGMTGPNLQGATAPHDFARQYIYSFGGGSEGRGLAKDHLLGLAKEASPKMARIYAKAAELVEGVPEISPIEQALRSETLRAPAAEVAPSVETQDVIRPGMRRQVITRDSRGRPLQTKPFEMASPRTAVNTPLFGRLQPFEMQ